LEKVNRKPPKRRARLKYIKHYLKEGERLCGVCLVKRFAFYCLKRQTFPSVHDIANAKFKEELKDFEQRRPDLANRLKSLLKKYMGEEKPKTLGIQRRAF
jgi:CRISPR-associated protein Cmr2